MLDFYQTFYLIVIANLHLYSYYNLSGSIPVSNALPMASTTHPNLITASIQSITSVGGTYQPSLVSLQVKFHGWILNLNRSQNWTFKCKWHTHFCKMFPEKFSFYRKQKLKHLHFNNRHTFNYQQFSIIKTWDEVTCGFFPEFIE